MKSKQFTWTVEESLQALKDRQIVAWFDNPKRNPTDSVGPGQARNAVESGIAQLLLDGFSLRKINMIEFKPNKFELTNDSNILLYLYALRYYEYEWSKFTEAEQTKILKSPLLFDVYTDIEESNTFILANSEFI